MSVFRFNELRIFIGYTSPFACHPSMYTSLSAPVSSVLCSVSFGSESHQTTCDYLGLTRPVAMACFDDCWTKAIKDLSWFSKTRFLTWEKISNVIPISYASLNSTVLRMSSCSPLCSIRSQRLSLGCPPTCSVSGSRCPFFCCLL